MDQASPKGELPQIEGQEGNRLLHTVSFYRKQKANVNVTPLPKVVRSGAMPSTIQEEIEVSYTMQCTYIRLLYFITTRGLLYNNLRFEGVGTFTWILMM